MSDLIVYTDRGRFCVPRSAIRSDDVREMLDAAAHPFRQFQAHVWGERFICRLRGVA